MALLGAAACMDCIMLVPCWVSSLEQHPHRRDMHTGDGMCWAERPLAHLDQAVPVRVHLLEQLGTPIHLPCLHGGEGRVWGLRGQPCAGRGPQ